MMTEAIGVGAKHLVMIYSRLRLKTQTVILFYPPTMNDSLLGDVHNIKKIYEAHTCVIIGYDISLIYYYVWCCCVYINKPTLAVLYFLLLKLCRTIFKVTYYNSSAVGRTGGCGHPIQASDCFIMYNQVIVL